MQSLILRSAGHFLLPLLLLFSFFLLLRGHDEPGGGFIGGLVASAAIALYQFSMDVRSARRVLRIDPRYYIAWGLLMAVSSGIIGFLNGQSFFKAQWYYLDIKGLGEIKLSTVLLFDIGVYFLVIGTVLTIVFSLAEAEAEN